MVRRVERWIVVAASRCAVLAFALWAGAAGPSVAADLILDGTIIQGGLVRGLAAPGARAFLDDQALRVSPEGRFVFGFGRDDAGAVTLRVRFADGHEETRRLDIAQRTYQEQRIDGLPPRQVTPNAEDLARIKKDNAEIGAARANDFPETWFAQGFIWPAKGPISGVYGSRRILNGEPRRPHFGVDVAGPIGTPVVAPAAGRVTLAATDHYYTGGTIILDHGHGVSSAFLHMDTVTVRVGDVVAQGAPLGTIGATGRVTGAHLDWRINWFDVRIDPQTVVGPME
ncbi:MAG: M23 family metallopeptidase [Alphaproteobacteria bacterium]